MNNKYHKLLAPLLSICITGCATATRVTRLEPVGPNPALVAQNSGSGFLQVFSARERVPTDVNAEEFFHNNDYGKNDFLHYPAHTSYAIYTADGHLVRQVRNNGGNLNNANPTTVTLSPGVYEVAAAAEDSEGGTFSVRVPAVVEAGLTTKVHLDGNWKPAVSGQKRNGTVCLPNGNFVGWRPPKPNDSNSSLRVKI